MKTTLCLLTSIFFFFSLLPASPVHADVAPPPPPQGASIAPGVETTQVRMVAETVLVDIAQSTTKAARARVTASFQMQNLGAKSEAMDVRFPLNSLAQSSTVDEQTCQYPDYFPTISDFTAKLDGKPARVTNHTVFLNNSWTGKPGKQVDCWASFAVTFDPGKDVKIEVSYTVQGYYSWGTGNLVEFPYVLMSGTGWKDTIGSADVTFRAPMTLDPLVLFDRMPGDQPATINGNALTYHFENIEPDFNLTISIMDPALWQRIQKEMANVQKNPKDGEAWGRLGKAYKEAIAMPRGYRWGDGGAEMYHRSKDAYEKAVTLLPRDADWHGGYAELLWNNVIFPSYGNKAYQRDDLVKAADQVRLALAINPNQRQANAVLEDIQRWTQGDMTKDPLVSIVNGKPVFLVLTGTPTTVPTDIILLTETIPASPTTVLPSNTPTIPAPAAHTPTLAPSATSTTTSTPAAVAQAAPSVTPPPATPPASKPQGSRGICGAGLVPLGIVVVWTFRRKGRR